MEKRFIMLELPNNIKEERNVLGVIKQPPAEVHDYRSILAEIQKIVAKINEIRNSVIGGYRLTLQLCDEDKINELQSSNAIFISAKTGKGIEELKSKLEKMLF